MIERTSGVEKKPQFDLTALQFSSIFRKYDIRGAFPGEINQSVAMSIGWAFGQYLLKQGASKQEVLVGHDSRQASYEVVASFAMGLSAQGFSVICQRECPTPMISKAVYDGAFKAGVSITASHNAVEQTGFKLYYDGKQLYDSQIQEIVDLLGDPEYIKQIFAQGMSQGDNRSVMNINFSRTEDYFYSMAQKFDFKGENPKFVVSTFSPRMEEYLANMFECSNLKGYRFFTCNRDRYVVSCDPAEAENFLPVLKFIRARNTKDCIGIMFDGDFDRVLFIDELGRVVDQSTLAAVLTKHLQSEKSVAIVADVCTGAQVHKVAKENGIAVTVSATGAPFVLDQAKKVGAAFSCESSGHYTFFDRGHSVDDGIYAAMRLLEVLTNLKTPLYKLVDEVPPIFSTGVLRLDCSPEMGERVIEAAKTHFVAQSGATLSNIDGLGVVFPDQSSCLLRSSNTQDKLVVLVQADTKDRVQALSEELNLVMAGAFEKEQSSGL